MQYSLWLRWCWLKKWNTSKTVFFTYPTTAPFSLIDKTFESMLCLLAMLPLVQTAGCNPVYTLRSLTCNGFPAVLLVGREVYWSTMWSMSQSQKKMLDYLAVQASISHFPQLFRSSDMAEGIQCVVRMSWVAAFAVFVSRTTSCQIIIRSIKQKENEEFHSEIRWQEQG